MLYKYVPEKSPPPCLKKTKKNTPFLIQAGAEKFYKKARREHKG